MSHRLLGTLLVLSVLGSCVLAVMDVDVTDTTAVSSFDPVKFEEDEEALSQTDMGDEVPVGRTLLLLHLLKQKLKRLSLNYVTTPPPFIGCICVPFYLCNANGTINIDGSGIIDFRQRRCPNVQDVCCYLRLSTTAATPMTQPTTMSTARPTPMTQPTTARPPPTAMPTTAPTTAPTTLPTTAPTTQPTTVPTTLPTTPSTQPTTQPPVTPITQPTTQPPVTPITQPTTQPPVTPITQPTTRPPVPTVPTAAPTAFPYCICIPVYQCAIFATGGANNGTGIINPRQQIANTCVGAFVCCNYATGVIPALPVPVPGVSTFPPFVLPSVPPPTVGTASNPAPQIVLPPIIFGQSCICTLISGCILGWVPMSGVTNMDPRLIIGRQGQAPATCGLNLMCCRLMQDNATFPLGTAVVPSAGPANGLSNTPSVGIADIKNPGTPNACICVATNQCADGNAVTYDNIGAIDPRFGPCASATLVCCRLQNRQRTETEVRQSSAQAAIVVPPPGSICGIRDTTYANTLQPNAGNTYFAEFPWMALLLVRNAGSSDVFQCGGSLINSRTVLTAAHCVVTCDPGTLIVRLGEWNTQTTNEPFPFAEYPVQRIVVHSQFYSGTLYNDVALVVLERQVTYTVNIRPVCLAALGQIYATGTTCYASGWGRNQFGSTGQYQTILRKVDLPIIDNVNCENRLRLTRLGPLFQLHPSFICAGGVARKDTCYKDGGGPLVCQDTSTGRFTEAGIISWGIGCGDTTPAVYASVAYARQWIDQQLALLGIVNV